MGEVRSIVNGTDNLVSIVLLADGVPLDMPSAGVTRVVIEVDDGASTVIDSDLVASMQWATQVIKDGVSCYPITFIGDEANLPAGTYRDCLVRVYDNPNPDGIIWPELLTLVVS